jgi:hypothetical protein
MKREVFLLFLLIFLSLSWCYGKGGYEQEVHTSFKASPGFTFGDASYFLLNYHLFKPPRGIRRFPDGGRVKTVVGAVYLMRLQEEGFYPVKQILNRAGQDTAVMAVKGRLLEISGEWELLFKPKGSDLPLVIRGGGVGYQLEFRENMAEDFPLRGDLSITFLSNLIRDKGFSVTGLPSPLDFIPKKERAYRDDLVFIRGDLFYRKAVIQYLQLSKDEAEEILERMDRRLEYLEVLKKEEYGIYSEETRL